MHILNDSILKNKQIITQGSKVFSVTFIWVFPYVYGLIQALKGHENVIENVIMFDRLLILIIDVDGKMYKRTQRLLDCLEL